MVIPTIGATQWVVAGIIVVHLDRHVGMMECASLEVARSTANLKLREIPLILFWGRAMTVKVDHTRA